MLTETSSRRDEPCKRKQNGANSMNEADRKRNGNGLNLAVRLMKMFKWKIGACNRRTQIFNEIHLRRHKDGCTKCNSKLDDGIKRRAHFIFRHKIRWKMEWMRSLHRRRDAKISREICTAAFCVHQTEICFIPFAFSIREDYERNKSDYFFRQLDERSNDWTCANSMLRCSRCEVRLDISSFIYAVWNLSSRIWIQPIKFV